MTDSYRRCNECGDDDGIVRQVYIAWPGGRMVVCWLHAECDDVHVARLEREGTHATKPADR